MKKQVKILLGLLAFFFVTVLCTGLLLKKGISIHTFSLGSTTCSQISLQWKNKLDLQIESVEIPSKQKTTQSLIFNRVRTGIQLAHLTSRLFSRISITSIRFGEYSATFHVDEQERKKPGVFTLHSNDLELTSTLLIDHNTLLVQHIEISSKRLNTRASGNITIRGKQENLSGTLVITPGDSLSVSLDIFADNHQIAFSGKGEGSTKTITPIINLFKLDKNIQPWVNQYLQGKRYHLKSLAGILPWKYPNQVLETLFAEIRIDDCEYTFAPGLEPIKTRYTDVTFSNGILYIVPEEETFYGQKIEQTRLNINFNDSSHILLTAFIHTKITADQSIVTLLNYYDIAFPFLQVQGKTQIDLVLTIDLNTDQVSSKGTFIIDKGVIECEQKRYDITKANILFDGTFITIQHMLLRYNDLFSAEIRGQFKPTLGIGDLDIDLKKFTYQTKHSTLTLDTTQPTPKIQYRIRPSGHSLTVTNSSWLHDGLRLHLGSFKTPFALHDFSGNIPSTTLQVLPGIKARIMGTFSLKKQEFTGKSELYEYKRKDLILETSPVPIVLTYHNKFTIQHIKESHWRLNNIETILYPSKFTYGDNVLEMIDGQIAYGNFFTSKISGQYHFDTKKGLFSLNQLKIKEKQIGQLINAQSKIAVKVGGEKKRLIFTVPELDAEIRTGGNKGWSMQLHNLKAIQPYSTLLQRYTLKGGNIRLSSATGTKPYSFVANLFCKRPLFFRGKEPLDQLNIQGNVDEHGVSATVNQDMQIRLTDQLHIRSTDIRYNIPAILKLKTQQQQTADKKTSHSDQQSIPITLTAENSSLYFGPKRQALADHIQLFSKDNATTMHLQHGHGTVFFEKKKNTFTVKGQNLNEQFMNSFFQGADFFGGTMNIAASGEVEKYSLLINIQDALLTRFTVLHNILAFLNTIPALVTFSLPEYDTRGLPIDLAVIGMHVDNGMATVESFSMDSPEIKMAGTGWINFITNLIDMNFNVTTRAKTNINKIPLAGYILAGKEKHPSITVHISGDLLDPKVENSVFQDIVTLPLSILYRTLTLPSHLVDSLMDSSTSSSDTKKDSEKKDESLLKQSKPLPESP